MAYAELIALGVVVALGLLGTFVVPGPDKSYVIPCFRREPVGSKTKLTFVGFTGCWSGQLFFVSICSMLTPDTFRTHDQ
jgi:hypothetical protein